MGKTRTVYICIYLNTCRVMSKIKNPLLDLLPSIFFGSTKARVPIFQVAVLDENENLLYIRGPTNRSIVYYRPGVGTGIIRDIASLHLRWHESAEDIVIFHVSKCVDPLFSRVISGLKGLLAKML